MTKLLAIGVFDIPHLGHAIFLNKCSDLADEVVVGVRSDLMVKRLRGHDPVFTYLERSSLIQQLGYTVKGVDEDGCQIIKREKPDLLAVGSDWMTKNIHGRYQITAAQLHNQGTQLVYLGYTTGISTTEIKARLGNKE